ncbi:hypothetical protein XM38_008300 [Halomicronema hongdechloris C2206]|uniref:CopZ zinc binding domain-containing protein n=1 Tax=Halomicronema hongdechloris C2206 TaxID=1641165 RepID=A0A1Z3HHZ4_9CYAN|nr:hypothetical protein XM38_008300 [Halomicronema hongdechloris C2206]
MGPCCDSSSSQDAVYTCPQNQQRGKPVHLITLKSLLTPSALARLEPQRQYRFCDAPDCPIVYFSNQGDTFTTQDLEVSIFQKDRGDEVLVCYCFGWSRQRLRNERISTGYSTAIESITAHVKANRCGCEVNNPQGSCCLGNVRRVIQASQQP